jgi:tetratricopeptide (TPR) repeat protein
MAYCQSLLYAQYMLERFGDDSLARLLDAYRQGMETNEAIPKTFKVSKEDFEKKYLEYVRKVGSGLGSFAIPKPPSFSEAQRFYRSNPKNPDAAANLAALLFARKQPDRARELAEEALKLKENHPGALCVLARMEASIGRVQEAEQILRKGFDEKNPDPQIVEQLSEYALRRKQFVEAAQLYEAAHRRDPLRSSWVEGLILALLKQKEAQGSCDEVKLRDALVRLCQMEADNIQARKKLAELLAKEKNWKLAEQYARETLHINVSDWSAHRILAEALFHQGRFLASAGEYELAASKDAKFQDGLLLAAEAYQKGGNEPKARQILREWIKKYPNDAKARKMLGTPPADL